MAQSAPICFETVHISNKKYFIASDWGTVPVNKETGEDLNSKKCGGEYFPPKTARTALEERGLAVARETMEIDAKILNQTDKRWKLLKITLNIQKKHDIAKLSGTKGKWEVDKSRSGEYHPYFKVDGTTTRVIDIPKEYIVAPLKETNNSRMVLEVEVEHKNITGSFLYEFYFMLYFKVMGGGEETFELKSDKTYFIVSE